MKFVPAWLYVFTLIANIIQFYVCEQTVTKAMVNLGII